VIDLNFMRSASDIPDWISGCVFNRELDLCSYTSEDVKLLHQRSPISSVSETKTPTLILLGDSDLRVPPHQSHLYFNALKQNGVECRLRKYPGEGHTIAARAECVADYAVNMSLWFGKFTNK
jgi:acylaminoacyl-peptidase